ncbi:MAG: 2-methylfumaryl-CoA isomerase [Acidimicrobiaceae bacterium]|nr:CoA transferase [Acidimicrobiales bacterium]MBC84544.1 2-methylfumaryl-CoA isomerase [Acidimicrobiaceae bacterium]OUV01729.1 MAG: 2-methylfumaryl-CoA isomerase [Acidimicrobiaceae bacterium TMED77]|tara:strand:+ start:7505 stop:8728 length:1224 start_codon:yes stop_codon:yes gene_type:complete
MSGPLSGMRVIEGSAFVAAPSGGMALAQLGAEVIRFDPIGGGLDYKRWPLTEDGFSLYWAGLNKGKKSIQVDLRSGEGQEILQALITAPGEDAGYFLTNFPAKGWLSFDNLCQRREDLIMLNVLGNHDGTTALDYTVNAAMGYPAVTGPEGFDGVINHVLPAWDIVCGQTAAMGLLAAGRHRERTGEGQFIQLALSDVALSAVAALGHIAEAQMLESERERIGNDLYGALGRDYGTSDSNRVIAVAITRKQWKALCSACEMTEAMEQLAAEEGLDLEENEGDRFKVRDRIHPHIEQWCQTRTLEEVRQVWDDLGVCWGPYQTFKELVNQDKRVSETNPMFSTINQPGIGSYLSPKSPLNFQSILQSEPLVAPLLGEHTEEILGGTLNLSENEIGKLYDNKIIKGLSN